MNWGRQTLPLVTKCRKIFRPTLSTSGSQRCPLSEGLGRLLCNKAHEGGNNEDRGNQQFSCLPQPAVPDSKSLLPESNAGDEYVRLVDHQIKLSASWDNAAFVFSLLQALRLALACLGSQRNPDLDLLVSFLFHLKLEIDAANKNDTLTSRQQLPRKIVKLPDHFFINEPDGEEPKVQIFPNVPFYVSPAVASNMQEKMAHWDWTVFIVYFLHEIYREDLVYLTALGKKNTQGIHPLIFKGLVAFALKKDDTLSETDVIQIINKTCGTEKIRFMRAHSRRIASHKGPTPENENTISQCEMNTKKWDSTYSQHKFDAAWEVQNSDSSESSIGAEYVQLVEQEIRQHASRESFAFLNSLLQSLRLALASHRNSDLEILESFLNTMVCKTAFSSEEKEALRTCQELPNKIVKLPDHYFVNEQIGKIPKVQIFPDIPFYISPALASIMEERRANWRDFVATFVEQIYGDDLIYLSSSKQGGKQVIHPLILEGLVDFSLKEDSSITQFDVFTKINKVCANKRRIVQRVIGRNEY